MHQALGVPQAWWLCPGAVPISLAVGEEEMRAASSRRAARGPFGLTTGVKWVRGEAFGSPCCARCCQQRGDPPTSGRVRGLLQQPPASICPSP